MKYTHSENTYFRYGIDGNKAPKPWLMSALDDPVKIMEHFIHNECWVYDADTCGDDTYLFSFDNGEAYTLEHSWWIDYDPEWVIHNEWTWEKVTPSSLPSWMRVERDWI